MPKFFPLSPALLSRIDRLSSCRGRWIVDCRELEGHYSYALRSLSEPWPFPQEDGHRYWHSLDGVPNVFKLSSPEDAAQYCAATRWQARILWSADLLNADHSWPGGYQADSVCRSNHRVFSNQYAKQLELADGDSDGLALDIRYITEEMLEDIESLEGYPLLCEEDHSALQLDDQWEAWQDWACRDFSRQLEQRLSSLFNDEEKAEQTIESLSEDALSTVFESLRESSNEYWQEESGYGQWVNIERVLEQCSDNTITDALASVS